MHNRAATGAIGAAMTIVLALTGTTAAAQGSAAAHADKKPARQMNTTLHQHPLQLRVRVLGGYAEQPTFLQKKTCRACTWHRVDTKKTDARGKVRYPLDAPATGNWFYRVGTPERAHYRESYSRVAKTYRL
jgi:hypothetical protein